MVKHPSRPHDMQPENGQSKLLNFSDHSPVDTVELIPKQQEMFLIHCLCWPLPLFKIQHWVVACSFKFDPSEGTIINTEQYIQRFRSSGMWGCADGLTHEEEGTCSFKGLETAHLRTQQHIPEGPDYLHSVRTWNIVTLDLLTSERQSVRNQFWTKQQISLWLKRDMFRRYF